MPKGPPKLVTINHDDYHAEHIGRTADGRQFFLTTPFVPADDDDPGREFIALYLFDEDGQFVQAQIKDLGTRDNLDEKLAQKKHRALLDSLGEVTFRRIRIAPFKVKRFGVEFGLIPQPPEEPDEDWCAIFMPGDVMCFWPPWNSGDYDT